MEDSKIVDLYLERDESAINHTRNKYGQRLQHMAFGIIRDHGSAEECENDTYLEAWNRIPPNEPRSYLFAFLGKIVRHLAIDVCRKEEAKKRSAEFCELTKEMQECIPAGKDVEQEVELDVLSEIINEYLKNCSELKRKVFVRRYWFFESVREISKRYGYSESKVKMILLRMREELRSMLEKEGYSI